MLKTIARAAKNSLISFSWRRMGAKVGQKVDFYGNTPLLVLAGGLNIGDRCVFRGGSVRSAFEVRPGGIISIGSRTFVNKGVEIQSEVSVTIGEGCLIGDEVIIQDTSFHEIDEFASPKSGAIVIGNNVWIARRVIVLPGVAIGDHAVIGAGSIVTRDVASKTVVAGAPAVRIRDVQCSNSFRR